MTGGKVSRVSDGQQSECCGINFAQSDGSHPPQAVQRQPCHKPYDDCSGAHAGEGSGRIIDVQQAAEGARRVGGKRQHAECAATDTGSENGGRGGPVQPRINVRIVTATVLCSAHCSPFINMITEPPRTGAYLFRKAPNMLAISVARKPPQRSPALRHEFSMTMRGCDDSGA